MEPSQAPKKDRKHRVMGSVLSVICMAAILASTLPATPVFAAEDPLTISETDQVAVKASATATTTDRLNLRAGAGSSYEVLTVLELGAQVTVLDDSNAEWVKVRTGSGQEGYCSREYLNMGVEAASSTLSLDTKSYTNTTGKSYRFLAKVSGGSGAAPTVTSSNTGVATVSYAGKDSRGYLYDIKTVGAGSATITVSVDGKTATLPVTVTGGNNGGSSSNASLTLDTKSYTNTAGKSYRFLAKVSGGSGAAPTVTSSNTGVATVSYAGKDSRGYLYDIKTVGAGSATITVSVDGKTATLPVTVTGGNNGGSSSNASLTLDTKSYTNTAGKSYRFLAKVSGGSGAAPTVTSSNTGVATVSYAGKDSRGYLYDIKTVGAGSATITVSVDGKTATLPVTVTGGNNGGSSSNASLTLDTKSYTNTAGKSYRFLAKVSGGSGAAPTVTSSDTGVATVSYASKDSRGYLYDIKTVKPGSATITVSVDGKTATLPVTVTGGNNGDNSSNVSLSLDTKSYTNGPGNSYRFLAKVSGGSGAAPTVTSSDTGVATVSYASKDSRGYLYDIKTVKPGSAIITVSVDGKTATLPVTVTDTVDGSVGNLVDPVSKKKVKSAVTTTGLNLRTGPGTTYDRIATLDSNTTLTPLDFTSNGWLKVKTPSSQVGYVSTEYLTYIFADGSTTAAQITLSPSPNSISTSIPQGKTLYMTATQSGKKVTGIWSSSNTDVATVSNGYVYGVKPGTATITVMDPTGTTRASMTVTITAAEPVKTAYVNPNIASTGDSVELIAVTDNTRDSVEFVVDMGGGKTQTVKATSFKEEMSSNAGLANNYTRVWKANITFSKAGTYPVKVYSYKNGTKSSTAFSTSAYVVSTQDETTTSVEQRRISDKMLEIIGKWEGYSAAVYPDTLANNIPTIGYGHTFSAGAQFYNNLTKTEAWSLLCNTINNKSYTSEVNKFIVNNKIKTNQQQFDAMVSFSYNIGAGYWNNPSAAFDMRTVMLNAVVPPAIPSGGLSASTSLSAYLYQDKSTSSTKLQSLKSGVSLTVLETSYDSTTHAGWYKVKLSNGTQGWVQSGYVKFASSVSVTHDLNYTDAVPFGSEAIRWSTASGTCYAGLVYRRLGEAKVFSFGDYAAATPGNVNYGKNTYGYVYPSYAKPYEK